MLGFFTIPYQLNISPSLPFLSAISSPSFLSLPVYKFPLHYSFFRSQSQISSNRRRFTAFASNKNNELDGNIKEREGERNRANGSSNGGDDLRKERGPVFNIKWAELLIDPDPDNILAVALTGLLAWASVQRRLSVQGHEKAREFPRDPVLKDMRRYLGNPPYSYVHIEVNLAGASSLLRIELGIMSTLGVLSLAPPPTKVVFNVESVKPCSASTKGKD